MTYHRSLRRFMAPLFVVPCAVACAMAIAGAPPRAEISSIQFSRSQAVGLESYLSPSGTQVKVLFTQGNTDWRAVDFEATKITAFVDGKGANLGLPDPSETGSVQPGVQVEGSTVAADGMKAVLTIWGGGIPTNGVDEIRVAGTAAVFCGTPDEQTADRADIRVAGGETFNVQPFRVVTSRSDGTFQIELRYLKSEALIQDATLSIPGTRLIAAIESEHASVGAEWVWRGSFNVPPRTDRVALAVRYLPITRVENIPFDLTAGLAFGTPPTNPVLRWLKRLL